GDALHAVLCGAGHNLRMILRKLRLLFAPILARWFIDVIAADRGNGRLNGCQCRLLRVVQD
ncbi:MAG: hypothetical protein LBI92_09525, partial [Azoarcus sp.]|nr:hypothetical protein [Azoarcus sp.]